MTTAEGPKVQYLCTAELFSALEAEAARLQRIEAAARDALHAMQQGCTGCRYDAESTCNGFCAAQESLAVALGVSPLPHG